MTDLYTVTLNRKQIITMIDTKGSVTGTKEEFIETKISDLPHRTALTYQRTFPDAFVSMELQAPAPTRGNSGYKYKGEGKPISARTSTKQAAPAQKPRKQSVGNGYADVINDMMKESA